MAKKKHFIHSFNTYILSSYTIPLLLQWAEKTKKIPLWSWGFCWWFHKIFKLFKKLNGTGKCINSITTCVRTHTHGLFIHRITLERFRRNWSQWYLSGRELEPLHHPTFHMCFFLSYHILNELFQIFCKSPIIRTGWRRMIWKCEHDILWNQQCFKKRYFPSSLNKSSTEMWWHTHTRTEEPTLKCQQITPSSGVVGGILLSSVCLYLFS